MLHWADAMLKRLVDVLFQDTPEVRLCGWVGRCVCVLYGWYVYVGGCSTYMEKNRTLSEYFLYNISFDFIYLFIILLVNSKS